MTVLLDDVHWADPASVDVIALLLHRPPERGSCSFAWRARTGRAPGVEDALHTAARHGGAEVLEVGALSREAVDVAAGAGVGAGRAGAPLCGERWQPVLPAGA